METMVQYVIRRASSVKHYKTNAKDSGIGENAWEWLKKLANREIGNPGANRIERLYRHYKLLEAKELRRK
jgi:phage gp16-like protein